ncbi:MAG: hypothetical protein DYH12_30420 [Sorangiineae bacterium PRO1]|nr:hypothetical protein [Sorangiineae bacterium PRO1]
MRPELAALDAQPRVGDQVGSLLPCVPAESRSQCTRCQAEARRRLAEPEPAFGPGTDVLSDRHLASMMHAPFSVRQLEQPSAPSEL